MKVREHIEHLDSERHKLVEHQQKLLYAEHLLVKDLLKVREQKKLVDDLIKIIDIAQKCGVVLEQHETR